MEGASVLVSLVATEFLSHAGTFSIDDEMISDTARAHAVQIEGIRAARGPQHLRFAAPDRSGVLSHRMIRIWIMRYLPQLGGWPSLPQPRIVTKYARIHTLDRQSRCRRRGPRSVRTVKSTDNEAEDEDETITSSRQGEQAAMIVGFRNKAFQWQHSMESENSDGSRATRRCEEEATR